MKEETVPGVYASCTELFNQADVKEQWARVREGFTHVAEEPDQTNVTMYFPLAIPVGNEYDLPSPLSKPPIDCLIWRETVLAPDVVPRGAELLILARA